MTKAGRGGEFGSSDVHLYLVRHGQTEWNLDRRLQGQLDSPLTELGCEQARRIGQRLAGLGVNHLVGSDLGRTRQTAEWVGKALGANGNQHSPYRPNEAYRERNLGHLQGKRIPELEDHEAREYEVCRTGPADYTPAGGESRQQLGDRGYAALKSLATQMKPGHRAAIVSHGGLLGAVLGRVLGIPAGEPRSFYVANCAFHHLVWRAGRFEVLTLGDVSHLAPA